ncbi:hypothetical protein P43SY_005022 [Pythium insidiosum]|uniref:TAZ-type domain-containing protein n=1 Tax=Pythium insidiosum TaxID=114742 RepID=A0AAD5LRZ7_PYTIN|nr:hypothetical protein P43SY_005022 [Pythium insidiosum]
MPNVEATTSAVSLSSATPPPKSAMASSTSSPESPVAVSSSLPLRRLQSAPTSHPVGKPPISPPSVHPPRPSTQRQSPVLSGATGAAPTLTRLPSLSQTTGLRSATSGPAPVTTSIPVRQAYRPPPSTPASQPMAGAPVVPVPPSTPTEEPTPRELAARLALLLHARECCTPFDRERVCGVRNCRVARGVLDHCQECFLPEGQCHRSCFEAKNLLRHFRVCRAQQFSRRCVICSILRNEFPWAMEHARSLTPLFVPQDERGSSAAPHGYASHHHHQHRAHPHQQHSHTHHTHDKRHPIHQDPQYHQSSRGGQWVGGAASVPPPMIRRTVSEGPHAAMNATHSKKRASPFPGVAMDAALEPSDSTHKRLRMEPSSSA